MTDFPDGIVIEARKAGLKQAKRKAADGSWFDVHDITFEIHPNDTNSPLSNMPLGTRVALVVTQLREEDAAEAAQAQTTSEATSEPEKLKGGPLSQRAGALCAKSAFQRHLLGFSAMHNNRQQVEEQTTKRLRYLCDIESRAELDHNPDAARIFEQIERDFHDAQQGITDETLAEQARMG